MKLITLNNIGSIPLRSILVSNGSKILVVEGGEYNFYGKRIRTFPCEIILKSGNVKITERKWRLVKAKNDTIEIKPYSPNFFLRLIKIINKFFNRIYLG